MVNELVGSIIFIEYWIKFCREVGFWPKFGINNE